MVYRNQWMIERHHIVGRAANGNHRRAERNRANLGWSFLVQPTDIIKVEGDQCPVLIADTENIAAPQWLAKLLSALHSTPLIEQTVERLATAGVRMHQHPIPSLTHDLSMKC